MLAPACGAGDEDAAAVVLQIVNVPPSTTALGFEVASFGTGGVIRYAPYYADGTRAELEGKYGIMAPQSSSQIYVRTTPLQADHRTATGGVSCVATGIISQPRSDRTVDLTAPERDFACDINFM